LAGGKSAKKEQSTQTHGHEVRIVQNNLNPDLIDQHVLNTETGSHHSYHFDNPNLQSGPKVSHCESSHAIEDKYLNPGSILRNYKS
jgi:hypothetical protein